MCINYEDYVTFKTPFFLTFFFKKIFFKKVPKLYSNDIKVNYEKYFLKKFLE